MIEYEKIGKRIMEERKYIRHISQERMAEDLGMYQADISNLEKAKSGITDLAKLDLVAGYLGMPLETLLFGRRQDQMEKYHGTKMQLKMNRKRRSQKHSTLLKKLMGLDEKTLSALDSVRSYECGPYMVYAATELQHPISGTASLPNTLVKVHLYVIYQDEVIGCMTANVTTMMQHLNAPSFEALRTMIMQDIFNLDDAYFVLNPYHTLFNYCSDDEEETELIRNLMEQRLEALRQAGEDRRILYIESTYVNEECRQKGIFRMMLDTLKLMNPNCLIWLSLEPTSGDELYTENTFHPTYEVSQIGQLHLNASIAERMGFTIDSMTVERLAERIQDNGSVVIETIPVQRTAYYLPKEIRDLIKDDRDMARSGRALKMAVGDNDNKPTFIDIYQSAWKKFGFIMTIEMVYEDEKVYVFTRGMSWNTRWLGVSKENPSLEGKFVDTIEKYESLEDAKHSKYYPGLRVSEQLFSAVFFAKLDPKEIDLDSLT